MTTPVMPETRTVTTAEYDVIIGAGLRHDGAAMIARVSPAHHYVVISDESVAALYGADLTEALRQHGRATLLSTPGGEEHKTRDAWATLSDALLSAGCSRDTTVVALGGGVVGDLAGFVAATYMRGIPVVQCPTSLLAMIDASVGGKTGVDTAAGKNLIGAFHSPRAVIADVETIATLPPAHRRAGVAEAIKHGVIADAAYFARFRETIPALLGADPHALAECVLASVRIKSDVVTADPHERGLRRILNFGHTLGHAMELVSGFALLHGDAVAIGMVLEARLAERLGVAQAGLAHEVEAMLRLAGLPVTRPDALAAGDVLSATRRDKKVSAGTVSYALPSRIGAMAGAERGWAIEADDALVREVLA